MFTIDIILGVLKKVFGSLSTEQQRIDITTMV